ncbi:MAG: phosphatidylglycerophosphatase A [Phycisphaerae bacterium]|nr:phosphatidylglycerophosphatase A [Phycisphaerae bacterium]
MKQAELFISGFGLGKLPWAPAVWGSLLPVVVYQVLGYLAPGATIAVMAFFVGTGTWACVHYAPAEVRFAGHVPSMVVADKVAGQALALLMISVLGPVSICNSMALGFVLFRVFDMVSLWPCHRVSTFPGGYGIVAQSLISGIYAGAVSVGVVIAMPNLFATL